MKSLIIDSSKDSLVIIFLDGDICDTYIGEPNAKRHNSSILVEIDNLLIKNNVTIRDIQSLGIVVGPGSFTGIRIGVSTINALAKANQAKTISITSLEIPSYEKNDGKERLYLLDCKHNNYYALYINNNEKKYLVVASDELKNYLCPQIYIENIEIENLIKAYNYYLESNSFVKQAKPFYLKKSSAEIEYEQRIFN